MLISKEINDSINQQIGNEFAASIQYSAISHYFADEGLPELSAYFSKQSDEERMHALKFLGYLGDSAAPFEIPSIPKPKCSFSSVLEAIQLAYDQEVAVTRQIEGILKIAIDQNNFLTQTFLQWFITEQLEEVSSMDNLLKITKRAGVDGLWQVEQYLARHGHPEDKAQSASDQG